MDFSTWLPRFNASIPYQSSIQIWIWIIKLTLEFWHTQNLLNIAMGVDLLIKVDPLTPSLCQGMYARVLVEVDHTKSMPKRIFVTKKGPTTSVAAEFFADIEAEKLPRFCEHCLVIGHEVTNGRRGDNTGKNFRRQPQQIDRRNTRSQKNIHTTRQVPHENSSSRTIGRETM